MSQTKKFKFQLILLLVFVSFFMFGCKNETPVEDIYFNLGSGEQIVLIVGQTLELDDYVQIKPSYATNKKYTITSFNEDVVKVENNKLIALKADTAIIKVVSNDNHLKECVMSVVVKATKEQLSAPLNLRYDTTTQAFSFDPVGYASSYTLKINGEEINLGNSNVYSLSQYAGNKYDRLLIAQVKANAPEYSFALQTSAYSNEYKIYQAGEVSNLRLVGGIVGFDKSNAGNLHNVYLGEEKLAENVSQNYYSLNALDAKYAGASSRIYVETVVPEEVKQQYGNSVEYFNSKKQSVDLKVLDVPNLSISATTVGWQNVAHASGYEILVNDLLVDETISNSYDLKNIENFNDIFVPDEICEIKVVAKMATDAVGVAKTTKENVLKIQRLAAPVVVCNGTDLKWNNVDNTTVYAIQLNGEDVIFNSSTSKTEFSMKGYAAGDYSFTISAVAQIAPSAEGVYYISSGTYTKTFEKFETLNASIDNYVLKINNLEDGNASLDFDVDTFDAVVKGTNGETKEVDLSLNQFAPGDHSIVLVRVGDENHIDSDETKVEFVQLEKVDNIAISNGVASIVRSSTNTQAIFRLETTGTNLISPIVVDNTGYQFNTTDASLENYLAAGDYSIKVYVCGNGSSTFSYRENGVVVGHATKDFEVLSIPTSELTDSSIARISIEEINGAEKYKIFKVEGESQNFVRDIASNKFDFVLSNGDVSYSVQAVGNGSTTLNSAISTPIKITRLKTPSLSYNNTTDVISKQDSNLAGVSGYRFTHNGLDISYDFVSKFVLNETANVFTLTALAVAGQNGEYFLNSAPCTLELDRISNVATLQISGLDNYLEISVPAHSKEFNLELELTLTSGTQVFKTEFNEGLNKKVLSNGLEGNDEIVLEYSYNKPRYRIKLLDDSYNAIIEEMNNGFSAKVRFVEPTTGNDVLINSDFSQAQDLALVKIDAQTQITINSQNQIVLSPSAHNQEFAFVLNINNGTEFVFTTNGSNKLINETYELDYTFRIGKYYINILDNEYKSIIDFNSGFDVKVQYSFVHNGIGTDIDSVFSETQTILVQPESSISRDGQNLKIVNVRDTYTYLNYSLLINNYILPLNSSAVSAEGYVTFDVEYIYSNTPSNYLTEINKVEVVVNNLENTNDNPVLLKKSEAIYICKTQAVGLSNYKYNNNEDGKNNNSTFVYFNSYETTYNKSYVIEFFGGMEKIHTIVCTDEDSVLDVISFALDTVEQFESVTGQIKIVAHVETQGEKIDNEKTVEVFNSINSNELRIEKIAQTSNLNVSNGVLTFNSIPNAVGYEVWEVTGNSKIKINSNLITSNSYEIPSNISGYKNLVVKAISREGNFTNSSYSDEVKIYKVEKPNVSVENGKIKVALTTELMQLMQNENIQIVPEISNGANENLTIDLQNLSGRDVQLIGTNLMIEPYVVLSYNSQSLTSEKCSVAYVINQEGALDGVFYINSNAVEVDCYGLFEAKEVKKTTADNNSVEMISWSANGKNKLSGNDLSVGYIFKIEYINAEHGVAYYSNNSNLKYYDKNSGNYVSYPSIITSTSVVFPAGYGVDADGNLLTEFGAGNYKISVQTIPLSVISGVNLCSSKFTAPCEFEIMEAVCPSVLQGKLVWDANSRADYYTISIYEKGNVAPAFTDTTSIAEYDFENAGLKDFTGIYNVIIKAISSREDTLNSANSADYYVYRLPQAKEVTIDDGYIIFDATYFLSGAIIEFVDTENGTTYVRYLDNTATVQYILDAMVADYNITDWENFTYSFVFSQVRKYVISLSSLNILDGRDYNINVKLVGNTHTDLGIVSSAKTISLSSMTTTKLKPNVTDVNLGVVQYKPDAEYATISKDGTYTSLINANYAFNGATSSQFWNKTALYKIVVTTSTGSIPIYAVDYYSFATAVANGTLSSADYELITAAHGLYACVKYNYTDAEGSKTIRFNVYENNMINLRDFDALYYYAITETMVDGANIFEGEQTYSSINLAEGGTFALEVYMLGGDSYESNSKTYGYLSSQANIIKPFRRYGVNQLTTFEGKVQFENAIQYEEGEVAVDYPVYKLTITPMNVATQNIVYVYHTSEEYARMVAQRHDALNFNDALYVQTEINEENGRILFDMSQYFDAGAYNISVRTLAGFGTGETDEQDYLLNAQEPTMEYTFQKLSDTKFNASNGILQFEQSYITKDGKNIYVNSYEISLTDQTSGTTYVYDINSSTEGVSIDENNHVVSYVIPKVARLFTENGIFDLTTVGGKTYSIKVRANSTDNFILNGTYKKENGNEVQFDFEKSLGIAEDARNKLRLENGILKWKVLDLENFVNTVIKVTFLDENSQAKNILIKVDDLNRYEIDGVYQYHYYQFSDEKYNLESSGSALITDKIVRNYEDGAKEEIIVYSISAYTIGKTIGTRNIVNSNLSSVVNTTRLSMVETASIKTVDGLLVWNAVENATSYEVILANNNDRYVFNVNSTVVNLLDEDKLINVGSYKIQITAIGGGNINSIMTDADDAAGFVQLEKVDLASVQIVDNKIEWNAVENADAYKVKFSYTDLSGEQREIINDELYEPSFTTPSSISGIFKIEISAITKGQSKKFNSQSIEFTSSSDAPMQVENFEFDATTSRLLIDVKKENFLTGDKLLIAYNFEEYIKDGTKTAVFLTNTISYMEYGKYVELDQETMRYFYPITKLGKYQNISVQVTRAGTVPSNAVSIADIDFNLFAYGEGTDENPYRIVNATQLLNIQYFTSANYELESSINMTDVNISERLEQYGAIISSQFSGKLNGKNFSIANFNVDEGAKTDTIELSGTNNFALFGELNNATIQDLSIGTENIQLILVNTFANSTQNMINLSLIATGANNSIINNVDVMDFKLKLTAQGQAELKNEVRIAGLIATAKSTTIQNSTVNINVEVTANNFNSGFYAGGVIAKAETSNVADCEIKFALTNTRDGIMLYVGGAIGYYEGNTTRMAGITGTNVEINISNVKATYLGGLVGFARYIKIESSTTQGTYSKTGIDCATNVGGLVGAAQSSTIKNSGSAVEFAITVSNTDSKFIGAIAGSLTIQNNLSCLVQNCYMTQDYREETQANLEGITLGICGHREATVNITGCYKLEN